MNSTRHLTRRTFHNSAQHQRRASVAAFLLLPALALVSACSQAPTLPTADESTRRPANAPGAIELQACRNELHNTQLLASESTRLAEATTAAMHQLAVAKGAMATPAAVPMASAAVASAHGPQSTSTTVYTLGFDNNSTQLSVADDQAKRLADDARTAVLIVIRGRTDAATDAAMNAKAARERAEAARDLLTAGGIDAKRIRVTWQAFGDHVADNASAEGKALNRRVEIELYRTAPALVAIPTRPATPNTASGPTGSGAPATSKDLQASTTRATTATP